MKKYLVGCASVFLAAALMIWIVCFSSIPLRLFSAEYAAPVFRVTGEEIQIRNGEVWEDFEIKGVNMGTGYPGLFPNESGIEEETYYRWFTQIAQMNANTIRVYKIQPPAFYDALLQFNSEQERKLYLIQGIDFGDELMYSEKNIHSAEVQNEVYHCAYDAIDAVHGRKLVLDTKRDTLHSYTSDVSPYVLAYILGVEWDDVFVDYVCHMNSSLQGYDGKYLFCDSDANAFEIFLAGWGEAVFSYEERIYKTQHLLSYSNWPVTDPLYNELKLNDVNDKKLVQTREAVFDLERIHATEAVSTGLFASYNVYPYFPDFLQYGDYTQYTDDTGKRNPYRKYLMTLTEHHSYPVVITEFGTPASRSVCYEDVWRNTSHGGLTEQEQGEALLEMYEDIQAADCAGAIVFTWQDEWYKTTWNDQVLSDPDNRAYWSNAQCAEQFFGLLAFEPGDGSRVFYPDGDLSEWTEDLVVSRDENIALSMYSDEKYVYFLAAGECVNGSGEGVQIALDVTPKSGAASFSGVAFDRDVDFVISIDSDGDSRLLVHAYYDALAFSVAGRYHESTYYIINEINWKLGYGNPGIHSNGFHTVMRASGNIYETMENRWTKEIAGSLRQGNANPDSPEYDSNADYCFADHGVEIRIPWQLLNFYDPSKRIILDDFHTNGHQLQGIEISRIYAAPFIDGQPEVRSFGSYRLKGWGDTPTFHERLKESYYILQEAFGKAES